MGGKEDEEETEERMGEKSVCFAEDTMFGVLSHSAT